MIRLRAFAKTEDRRLDRIEYFDQRSKNFRVTATVDSTEPVTKIWHCPIHLDQGTEGACTGFGCSHELIAAPVEVSISEDYARMIYREAKKIDPWPGEDYEGTSVLAAVEVVRRLGWIDSYHWALSLEDLIVGIGHRGPAVMGMRWYQGMDKTDRHGFIRPTGRVTGGHCILCKGVNIESEFFTMHNSWGDRWGVDGDCFITFEAMQKLLDQGGEAAFFVGRHDLPREEWFKQLH